MAIPDGAVPVLDKGFVRLVDHMGNDAAICSAARVSYAKTQGKGAEADRSLIRYMMRHRHTSPFEHVVFRFHVKAPLFVLRQWHRHRTWSYNELSGRYAEMVDEFYLPDLDNITQQSTSNKQGGEGEILQNAEGHYGTLAGEQQAAYELYQERLAAGMRRELARINLPLATYTEMHATVDLHNLFHFFSLRLDSHTQLETRAYADALFSLVQPIAPIACEAFVDYRLNAITLSHPEVVALRTGQPLASVNKREQTEWEEKKRHLWLNGRE